MTNIPGPGDITVHFAHTAYCLADRFALRRPDIAHFQTWTPEETRARIGDGDVLVTSGFWSNDLLAGAARLRYIQVCAVGHDQFDKPSIATRGIRLCNAVGVNANAVSDHAFALLLGLTRHIHVARTNQLNAHWRGMISDLTKREEELPGKTMVIYGLGAIGGRIARLAKAFGMTVLGIRRDVSQTVAGVDELHSEFRRLLDASRQCALDHGIAVDIYEAALFAVVAYIDELLLTSDWEGRREWQHEPLQRINFDTTSAGAEFYDRLNELNKFGPDRDVREVYALCLGLGFRGKYFRGEDRKVYEDAKAFNLSLLLPEEAQRNIDAATLFPFAYKGHSEAEKYGFKPRLSIYPILIGVPVVVVVGLALFYRYNISSTLQQIQSLVQ